MAVTSPRGPEIVRARLRVTGTVQGVGFRPHVYRLAHALQLSGFVLNDSRGVLVEVEGPADPVEEFQMRLRCKAPPLAAVADVIAERVAPTGVTGFRIATSALDGHAEAAVSPDTATCGDCLRELFDPADRRYRYPFINCTNCGPRFTIVRGVPYDRPLTTMASFAMCEACQSEYHDPLDRRFHAQPNACPVCGPRLTLLDGSGTAVSERDQALRETVRALWEGKIVAIKGIGGFHLACLANDQRTVAALRSRKHREEKPFALMTLDIDAARGLVELSDAEGRLLQGPERPIVIARRRTTGGVAAAVAPRARELGVMLPYSPLHHLLLADVGQTLVMTSGNVSDEPIAYRDGDALERLTGIADLFLVHDRPIQTRTDDSVLRAVARRPLPLLVRRSRGYVPAEIRLPVPAPRPVLACGAELKSTFCLVKGDRAWVSHHIGDLENYDTLRSFKEGIEHLGQLFAIEPQVVAHDLHPEYLSTKYALGRDELEPVAVQHHHAHLAACLAEHRQRGPAVGAIYDGTGYGPDGGIWGGELLIGDLAGFERVGHLSPVRLPGGHRAVREPWRMACAWITAAVGPDAAPPPWIAAAIEPMAWRAVQKLCLTGLASPVTTSVGRLFDAIAALCGLRLETTYEGQAAVELEATCASGESGSYPLPAVTEDGAAVLDARPTIRSALADLESGVPVGRIAARFHNGLAAATAAACTRVALQHGLHQVVLAGGSFQNRLLLELVTAHLQAAGLRVLVPERLPPNDGAISFGQAAVAAARDVRARRTRGRSGHSAVG